MAARSGAKRLSVTGIKRRQANDDAAQLQLERVFGVTLNSNCALCFDPVNSVLAYPAGCTIVLYNVLRREQHFIINSTKKVITCLDISGDGKFLASGEFGHNPAVRIWELSTRTQLAEFGGHKFAIACVRFSRAGDQRFVVSIGNQFDQSVCVWNWRTHKQAASNRNTAKIHAVAFAPSDHFFVTVGVRHVRFWSIQAGSATQSHATVPLSGRNAILGDLQNNVFIDVACACLGGGRAQPSTFALTQSGTVCQFDERRVLTRCIDARADASRPTCLCLFGELLFVGAFDGQVAAYSAATLQLATHVPKPHNVLDDVPLDGSATTCANVKYPDVLALAADPRNGFLAAVYNDHSVYVWNVAPCDIENDELEKENDVIVAPPQSAASTSVCVSLEFCSRAHSKCVWHVEVYPFHFEMTSSVSLNDSMHSSAAPLGSCGSQAGDALTTSGNHNASLFVTCGNDCTLRFWRVANDSAALIRTVALEADCSALLDSNVAAYTNQFDQQTATSSNDVPISYFGPAATGSPRVAGPKGRNAQSVTLNANSNAPAASDAPASCGAASKSGLKVVRFRPDGHELAVGDRVGNVRVLRVTVFEAFASIYVEPTQFIAAHDNEVTALEYLLAADCCLLASASRDRMVHIFNAAHGYEHLQTLDEHSSVVNAIRFVIVPPPPSAGSPHQRRHACNVSTTRIAAANVRCVSCSADHSLLFRSMLTDEAGHCRFVLAQNTALKTALYDIDTDVDRMQLTVVGQDRFVRSFCADTCKPTRQFRAAVNEHANSNGAQNATGASALTAFPIRVAAAPSGAYTALALTNKDVQLYDAAAASLLASANGHGELVLGLRFSHDSRRLVTVAGDGCVFIWRVSTPAERRTHVNLTSRSATTSPLRRAPTRPATDGRVSLTSAALGRQPTSPSADMADKQWRMMPDALPPQSQPADVPDFDQVPCRDVPQVALGTPSWDAQLAGTRTQRVAGAWAQRAAGEPLVIKSRLDQSGAVTLTVDQLLAFDSNSSRRRISMDGSVCTVDLAERSMSSSTTGILPSFNAADLTFSRDRSSPGAVSTLADTAIREERESTPETVGDNSGRRADPSAAQTDPKHDQLTASSSLSDVLTLPESDRDRDLLGAPAHTDCAANAPAAAVSSCEPPLDDSNVRAQIEHWLDDVDAAGADCIRALKLHSETNADAKGDAGGGNNAPENGAATTATTTTTTSTPNRGETCFVTPQCDAEPIDATTCSNRYVEACDVRLLGAAAQGTPPTQTATVFQCRPTSGTRETCTQRYLQMARARIANRQLRFAVQQDSSAPLKDGLPLLANEWQSEHEPETENGLQTELAAPDCGHRHASFDETDCDCDCCDDLFTIVTGLGHSRAHRNATVPARTAKDFGDRRTRSASDAEFPSLSSTTAATAASASTTDHKQPRGTAFRVLGSPMRNSSRGTGAAQKANAMTNSTLSNCNSPARRLAPATHSFTRQRQLLSSPAKLGAKSPVTSSVPSQLVIACPLRDQLGYVHALQTHVERGLGELLRQCVSSERLKAALQLGAVASAIQLVGFTEQNANAAVQHCKTLRAELEERLRKQSQSGCALHDTSITLSATEEDKPPIDSSETDSSAMIDRVSHEAHTHLASAPPCPCHGS